MAYRVTLAGQGWTFEVAAAQTVLQAAEQAGIRLPSSCRNGTCRTCLCRASRGTVRHVIEWPGLSAEEKRDGYLLPCVAQPTADLLIEAPAAMLLQP